jgi:membrane-bound ClpP family serine protease
LNDTEEQVKPGAWGRTLTTLLPSGKVLIDGVEYKARVQRGWVDEDEDVVVVGLDAFGLIVDRPESQES